MQTLSHFTVATWVAPWLGAIYQELVEGLRGRRARLEARRAAQAFERLDDRTLRDLGLCRGGAGAIGPELHCPRDETLRRFIQMI